MKLIALIQTNSFVDFKFTEDFDNNLYATRGSKLLPSEIYNYKYDCFIALSTIVDLLYKEVIVIKNNNE